MKPKNKVVTTLPPKKSHDVWMRVRSDRVVGAVYCSEDCAVRADKPNYGPPSRTPLSERLMANHCARYEIEGMECPCGKAL